MTQLSFSRFVRFRGALLGCCIAVTALVVASCSAGSAAQARSDQRGSATVKAWVVSGRAGHRARTVKIRVLAARDPFAGCEQRIERGPRDLPALAIVGASYTAGVGPDNPALSWAADLARHLRWNSVIYGVPGAGYVRTGTDELGPMARMLDLERLPGLDPALVIVQAGHDDSGVPARIERRQVTATIDLIRDKIPHAQIALVTAFASPNEKVPAALWRTDHAIVTAALDADPRAIIMDPLTGHWKFQHAHDRLHPTAAGDRWIAAKVASILYANGIDPTPSSNPAAAVICDLGVHASGGGDA